MIQVLPDAPISHCFFGSSDTIIACPDSGASQSTLPPSLHPPAFYLALFKPVYICIELSLTVLRL